MASDLALLALVKKMDGFTGPQGPAGAPGPSGPQGPQGPQGPAGSNGRDGKDGAAGAQGPQGPQGPQGLEGPAGEAGAAGEDGVGVETAYIAADNSLVFTLTDGSEVDVGPLSGLPVASEGNTYVVGQGSGAVQLKWLDYATGFSATPTLLQTIADGDVYEYTYSNGTLYRLVPSGSEQDSFYSAFSGGVLSGLVASKGVTI